MCIPLNGRRLKRRLEGSQAGQSSKSAAETEQKTEGHEYASETYFWLSQRRVSFERKSKEEQILFSESDASAKGFLCLFRVKDLAVTDGEVRSAAMATATELCCDGDGDRAPLLWRR
nr:hypothetical protein Iba_chr10cCG11600 [Ipomoea batatas]GMD96329.1 hypothetical protein Iba_chr15bCG3730 [Ipomoea batatas]